MKKILILLICFWWTASYLVLSDDNDNHLTLQQSLNQLNHNEFEDPGPVRNLPRSERKRLRLLKMFGEHKIKKRDVNNDIDNNDDDDDNDIILKKKYKKKTITINRGSIKAIDTIKKKNIFKNDENYFGGSKNFEFAYNLNNHNRREKLYVTRTSKKLNDNSDDSSEEINIAAKGSYSFISADGFKYTTKYIADNKGFRPIVLVEKI